MNPKNILLTVLFVIAVLFNPTQALTFQEGWESAQPDTYSPDNPWPFIEADEGFWVIGDTVSEFPECGPTPQTVEIDSMNDNQILRLTSNDSNSSCSDNVWVVLFEIEQLELNTGFSIPLSTNTTISFDETGDLPGAQSASPTCLVLPCGDTISLLLSTGDGFVGNSNGVSLAYVLQRADDSTPNTIHSDYREIFLDPEAGAYERNLFSDFATIPDFIPNGAEIKSIEFKIQEHGSATIDNICVGPISCGQIEDNCPNDPDKLEPGICGCGVPDTDTDNDGQYNCIDNCPDTHNPDQVDADGDLVGDVCDNCREVNNPDQRDSNYYVDDVEQDDNTAKPGMQHYGDICDPDYDNNGLVKLSDFSVWRMWFRSTVPPAPEYVDHDGDGLIKLSDFSIWRKYFRSTPGPGIGD